MSALESAVASPRKVTASLSLAQMVNGDLYEGSWENGVKHGRGTYYYAGQKGAPARRAPRPGQPPVSPAATFRPLTPIQSHVPAGVYQGVWANDVAKCGEYVNNPDKVGRALPVNELRDPEEARSGARWRLTPPTHSIRRSCRAVSSLPWG